MPAPLSTHLPYVSGAVATVPAATGTLVVDTGMRDLQSLVCSMAQDAVGTAATCSWELVTQSPGTTRKVTLKTWDEDGVTAGSTAAFVTWIALGK
jgi:hypothetical protein